MPSPPIHVIIPTHTTRHLHFVLVGLALQTRRPDSVTVSCDTDDQSIGELIGEWSRRLDMAIAWVRREHHGVPRLCQVRNNALRHVIANHETAGARVLQIDGDMLLAPDAVELHLRLAPRAGLLAPYRINLSETRTAELDPEAILAGEQTLAPAESDLAMLRHRHRRARKHALMRRLHLAPLHKPKILGGHVSFDLALIRRLNGFDEEYEAWGYDDDSLCYRAARLGARVFPCAPRIIAWHLYHPTRQDSIPMTELPNARRFAERHRLPLAATHGIDNPVAQHDVQTTRFPLG